MAAGDVVGVPLLGVLTPPPARIGACGNDRGWKAGTDADDGDEDGEEDTAAGRGG